MGSSSEPSYLRKPITSTDKLLGHNCFLAERFLRFSSHNHIQHEQKNAKTQTAYSFRYIVNIAKFEYYQGAKFEATVSRNSLDYIIYNI